MHAEPADNAATPAAKAAKRSRKTAGKPAAAAVEAAAAISLDADLGIDHTAGLREQLARRLDDAEPVVFEAAAVQRIHTSTLQLFLMFCRDRRAAGRSTVWRNPSTSLQAAAQTVGLASQLELAGDPS
jgi:anti-anti-sigma regulatory factor